MTYREMVDMINVYVSKRDKMECYQFLLELEKNELINEVASEFSKQLKSTSDVKVAFYKSVLIIRKDMLK